MKKVLIRGPVLSQSGYGEQTRFAIRSLRKFPDVFDIYLLATPWGNTGWIWENNEERRWIDACLAKTIQYVSQPEGGAFDISLQVTIPPEWEKMAPVNVGYTAGIETTKMDASWMEPCMYIDRIITVSEHGAFAIRNTEYNATKNDTGEQFIAKVQTPVHVVNYAARPIEPDPIDLDLEYDFNFLIVAQWSPRKNLEMTIKWFVEEFFDKKVGLVVKINSIKNCYMDREFTENRLKALLQEYKDRKCGVYLLHGDLTEKQMAGLYVHPKIKCLINLAHGEGYGLPMFEAVCNGLPLITPAWGGQNDFIFMKQKIKERKGKAVKFVEKNMPMVATVSYDIQRVQKEAAYPKMITPDSSWCYAKDWHYKSRLREMKNKYPEFKSKAKKLQEYVLREFAEDKMYRKFAEALLGEQISSANTIDIGQIPKISILTSVFNGKDYLEGFFEDLTRQTIWDKCELVIINANPKRDDDLDNEIIFKWQTKYPDQIKYKWLDQDPGIYGCWNEALSMATGEFITNANLDDRKRVDSLERHARELLANPTVDLVYADSYKTDAVKKFEDVSKDEKKYSFEQFSPEAMLRGNQPHNNPMWRKSLHDKVGLFNPEYKSAGDWEFFLRCVFDGNATFKKINELLGVYYFNPTGMSTNPENTEWKQKEEMRIFQNYRKKYLERKKENV